MKKNFIFAFVFGALCTLQSFGFDVTIGTAPGNFYLGEGEVVIPVKISWTTSTDVPEAEGFYTISILSGPAWLTANHAAYVSGVYWTGTQNFWMDISGTPEGTGNFTGTVEVCNTSSVCVNKNFAFTVLASTKAAGIWNFSWDPASSYNGQIELNTQFKNASGSDFILTPQTYYDYYLTMNSRTVQPMFDFWWAPNSADICLEVRSCGSQHYIMRHRFRTTKTVASGAFFPVSSPWKGVETSYQQKDTGSGEPTVYISEKLLSTDRYYGSYYYEPGSEDWSYPIHQTASYDVFARRRRPAINDSIVFYKDGVRISGDEPPAWAVNANCPVLSLANGDFLVSDGRNTTYEFCDATEFNTAPTLTFSTAIDTIYSGEDYVAFPAFSDADGDSVWLALVSGPSWIEVGTPADYLDSADWPHKYGNSLYYIRSVNTEIRRHALVNAGLYTYSVQAHDKNGAVSAEVSHQVRILSASAHPSAVGKNLGVLMGDETWFRKYQLDIASGVVNFSGEPVTLTNFYYDYYGYKAESPNASIPHYWFSDSSITPNYAGCGEGRFRIRYQYSGTKTFNSENSYFDNKAGIVFGSGSIMNKRDDWSMLSFTDTSRSRRYAANMPLYNGDGTLLWGAAPTWAESCGAHTPTLTFSTETDTIYSGEDYVAFPAFSDADDDSVWLTLESGPAWIEVGTPADYLDSADWPHKYGNSLYYIRSVNTEIRRHALVNAGLYTYSVQAHDQTGAVSAVVSHQVRILPASAHPSAVGKNLGVLVGDETWFRKYQLDVASGIVNFSGGPVTLTNFYYDYYGYKAEWPTSLSSPHYWYSDTNITPSFVGCGEGRFRIRYQYSGTKTFDSEYSYLDNKAGFVYGSGSLMNKRDDWSMLSFADTSRSRRYAANMPLYNGDGTLLWGTAPSWSNACGEEPLSSSSSAIESSSSVSSSSIEYISSSSVSSSSAIISSSSVSSSSSTMSIPNLVIKFLDSNPDASNQIGFQASIANKGDAAISLAGYVMRFYYNDVFLLDASTLVFESTDSSISYKTEKCAEGKYSLTFDFADSVSVSAGGRFPLSQDIKGMIHTYNWQDQVYKKNQKSWRRSIFSSISALAVELNPKMALFDSSGQLVYGTEAWPCGDYVPSPKLAVYVRDPNLPDTLESEVVLTVENNGDSSVAGPLILSYYFTHPTGHSVNVVTEGDTLAGLGTRMLDDSITVMRHTAAGNRHVLSFSIPSGLVAGISKSFAFTLYDACLYDCNESMESQFHWNRMDDWSQYIKSGRLATGTDSLTENVTIADSLGTILYGKADLSAPSYTIVKIGDDDSISLSHARATVEDQVPNRTDAAEYSGGQLLSGGDFEALARGWTVSGTAKSVRGGAPGGSRYLSFSGSGTLSQTLPSAALKIARDSGLTLTFWRRWNSGNVSVNGTSQSMSGYVNHWVRDTLTFAKNALPDTGDVTITFQIWGVMDIDDAVLVPGALTHPITQSVRFTTTQHEEIETRSYDGATELLLTTAARDVLGRPYKKYLPFALDCEGVEDCNGDSKAIDNPSMATNYYILANPNYPDAQGYPYAETEWKPDQAATADVMGNPGKAFSLTGDGHGTHLARAYSSGVNLSGVNLLDSVSLSNAVSALENTRVYDNKDIYHAEADANPTHLWELSVDPDGRKSFTVKDGESRVIVSGALDANGYLLMRSVNELDARGNVIKSHPPVSCSYTPTPAHCVEPSTFAYDSESRVVKSTEPDAGEMRSYYDVAGRVRATQTQRQIDSGTATVTGYDGIDRAIYSGVWAHSMTETQLRNYFKDMTHRFDPAAAALDSATLTRNFYDRMPGRDSVLTALGVELYPASLTADSFRYTKTRLVATVSRFRDADGTLKGHSVAYRHDKKGRVIASYVYNGGVAADSLKLLATETEYDLAGKVLKAVKYPYGLSDAGKNRAITERYTYDRRGRVDTLYVKNGSATETVLATYDYYPTGSVKQIALGGGALTLGYTYHISGAVKTATARNVSGGTTLYSETLDYEDCGSEGCTPQYAGNISRMMHTLAHGNTNYGENRDVVYAYDLMNRLTNVDDAISDDFDEVFAYDPQGRIVSQRRGANVANTAGGDYAYYTQSNRLEKVTAGMSAAVDAKRLMNADSNFVYDKEGNMTYDASKKMAISYDYRGLPTEFAKQELNGDSVRLLMAYDGSGARISKRYERKNAGETAWTLQLATHYTGVGSEIRENGLDNTAKVVVNLPQGLGRYGVENAVTVSATTPGFEWYLKNHLGSTMLVYGTGSGSASVKAAYDYRAFGEQVNLVNPSDKVTENFTGKERDDETELGYWGARYLDQMLGMWVSVDTKRQFSSPFLYAGNGVNPIVGVDKDGNEVVVINNEQSLVNNINRSSYDQFSTDKYGSLAPSYVLKPNTKGNTYYGERLNAAIESPNTLFLYQDAKGDYSKYGEGVTLKASTGYNDAISVVSGKPYGKSSAAQNEVHEIAAHGIPFILGDRNPAASAMDEERKAIQGVYPYPDNVPDHPIGDAQ